MATLPTGAHNRFRLLGAFSGIIVVILGGVFALKAPFMFDEFSVGHRSISHPLGIRRFIGGIPMELPILPVTMIILGVLTYALALRGRRYLTLPTSLCLGLIITSLTFAYRYDLPGWTDNINFGYPFCWLTWSPDFPEPRIVGVLAPMFLIDVAFWSLVAWAAIFVVNRIKKILSRGDSLGGVSPPSPKRRAEREQNKMKEKENVHA